MWKRSVLILRSIGTAHAWLQTQSFTENQPVAGEWSCTYPFQATEWAANWLTSICCGRMNFRFGLDALSVFGRCKANHKVSGGADNLWFSWKPNIFEGYVRTIHSRSAILQGSKISQHFNPPIFSIFRRFYPRQNPQPQSPYWRFWFSTAFLRRLPLPWSIICYWSILFIIFKEAWESDRQLSNDQRQISLMLSVLQDLNLYIKPYSNHLYPSTGTKAKHLVFYYWRTSWFSLC